MRRFVGKCLIVAAVLAQAGCAANAAESKSKSGYLAHPEAQKWLKEQTEAGLDSQALEQLLAAAKKQKSILEAISRPAERRLTWGEYRKIFIEPKRINQGLKFWQTHADVLARAEKEFGVPAEVIVAIIGVETRYGRIMGSYRVVDALATLGFDYPKRGKFFRKQLAEYAQLVAEEKMDPLAQKGSYAGAMGFGQFIPSSYRAYAVDFDGDGKRDILTNRVDAIGSVANYFARHGWKSGEPVLGTVKFGDKAIDDSWFNAGLKPKVSLTEWAERGIATDSSLAASQPATLMKMKMKDGDLYWLGLHNFYVITRYNHSRLYAMAVYELSQIIREKYQQQQVAKGA